MCGGGGGGGQRALEAEEKDLLRMQSRVAEQGIRGRDQANAGFESFVARGRALGSQANQDAEAGRVEQDATTAYGNAQRMQDTRMASMGVNPGDPRFTRGRDTQGVAFAGQTASGMNQARAGARAEGLKLEGAGLSALAGNDPTAALSSMGQTISSAAGRQMSADQASAAGWGQLGMGAMYGLSNYDKIADGAGKVAGWFGYSDGGEVESYAEGGEVRGIQRYAAGGNVYDRAMGQVGQMRQQGPQPRAAAPQGGGMGVDPLSATRMAEKMVNKASAAIAPTPSGTGLKFAPGASESLGVGSGAEGAGLGLKMPVGAGEMLGTGAVEGAGVGAGAAEGAGLGLQAGADAAAMMGAGAAEGTAAASALGAVGTALPWVGGALAIGSALGLFADGGEVGINRRQRSGVAENPNGGRVSGPGGPKDDMVMARLSPGEFVLPVGTVRKYGLARLEKMRQEGLEFEKQQHAA